MKTRVWLLCGLMALLPTVVQAQVIHPLTDGVTGGTLSANGTDCSVEARCLAVDVRDIRSWTVDLVKGTSITLVWEVRSSAGGTWRAYPGGDDINGGATTSTDGLYLFTNAGYDAFRVRASAISGAATVVIRRGAEGVKSTAAITLNSAGDASATNQTSGNQKTQIVDGSGNVIGATSNALDVNVKSGAQTGVTDDEDGSIAAGKTGVAVSASLGMVFNGTGWDRFTFGTAGTAASQVWTVQGIASMTPLLVTDGDVADKLDTIIGALSNDATASETALTTGPQIMGRYASAPDDVSDGEAAQVLTDIKGRIVLGATTNYIGKTRATDGTNDALVDPCTSGAKTTTAISQTSITNIISADANKTNYICALTLVAGAAEIINIVEDDTSGCGSPTAALVGSTTAANGVSVAANGGFAVGNGQSAVLIGTANNRYLCISQNGSNRVSGFITWVQR